jgi:hypothetical protein
MVALPSLSKIRKSDRNVTFAVVTNALTDLPSKYSVTLTKIISSSRLARSGRKEDVHCAIE